MYIWLYLDFWLLLNTNSHSIHVSPDVSKYNRFHVHTLFCSSAKQFWNSEVLTWPTPFAFSPCLFVNMFCLFLSLLSALSLFPVCQLFFYVYLTGSFFSYIIHRSSWCFLTATSSSSLSSMASLNSLDIFNTKNKSKLVKCNISRTKSILDTVHTLEGCKDR